MNSRPSGYDIYEVTPNKWILQIEGQRSFTGTLAEIGVFAVKRFDFSVSELELAIEHMIKNDHDAANFGTNQSFIYTYKRNKTNELKTG